jgi:hypothetical protein
VLGVDSGTARRHLTLAFPIAAFAVWRVAHEVALRAVGGPPQGKFFAWDASWYKIIWDHGYGYDVPGTTARPTNFFPLLPWLGKAARVIVPNDTAAATVVVTAATVAAVCLVYLVAANWRGAGAARWTVVLLLASPHSLFLHRFFTEGLFLALTAGALLAHQRRRPVIVAACLAGATMTRVLGVVVVAVLVIAAILEDRRLTRRALLYALGALGVIPVLVAQGAQAGNPVDFFSASEAWGRQLSWPWQPFVEGIRIASQHPAYQETVVFDLAAAGVFVVLAAIAAVRRWPFVAWALMAAMVAVPLSQGFVSSLGRYMLAAWPGFAVAGVYVASRARPFQLGVVFLLAVSSVVLLRLYSLRAFVG